MGFTELCIRRPVFATVLSLVLGTLLPGSETSWYRLPTTSGSTVWI